MNNKLKGVTLAVVVGLALTGLTYFYATPIPLLAENDPFFWYYSVISVEETSTSTLATLHGFPFSYVLESEAVFIFGLFSFILDFILFIFIGSLILWLLLRSGNEKFINMWEKTQKRPAQKRYPRYPRK